MTDEQTGVIRKVPVANESLDDWLIPAELITAGSPVAKWKFLWQSEDKCIGNGTWTCEIGSYNWEYTWDETIYIIDGEVTITENNGNSNTYRAGDLIFVPAGTRTSWDIIQPIRKIFHIRSDDPVEL